LSLLAASPSLISPSKRVSWSMGIPAVCLIHPRKTAPV
jgi:hypothetical protein